MKVSEAIRELQWGGSSQLMDSAMFGEIADRVARIELAAQAAVDVLEQECPRSAPAAGNSSGERLYRDAVDSALNHLRSIDGVT